MASPSVPDDDGEASRGGDKSLEGKAVFRPVRSFTLKLLLYVNFSSESSKRPESKLQPSPSIPRTWITSIPTFRSESECAFGVPAAQNRGGSVKVSR